MALEGLAQAGGLGLASEPLRLGLGARHDGRADVGLEGEVDVHHAEFVGVAARPRAAC